jgi:hypothetical protein
MSKPTNIYHSFKMLKEIGMRGRLNYNAKNILSYLTSCLCLKRFSKWKNINSYRKHLIFKRGKDKLKDELDILNLIRSSSYVNLMSEILLTKK